MNRSDVYVTIDDERTYQDLRWGDIDANPHTVGEWLLILQGELDEAIKAWQKSVAPPHSALDEVRQIAAVAVACLEQHDALPRAREDTNANE